MFIEKIIENYGYDTPILTKDILSLFSSYTKAYIFRLIKSAEETKELISYSRGIYYIPRKTCFGQSSIYSNQVIEKKYIKDNENVYGIYSGLYLLNEFGITEQVPNIIEITTNNEATRKRTITIGKKKYILRKSRCEITDDNYSSYTLVQLFYDMNKDDKLSDLANLQIGRYIRQNNITKEKLLSIAIYFPLKTYKKMIESGVFDEIA